MKARRRFRKEDGTTLLEVVVLVAAMAAITVALYTILVPRGHYHQHRVSCVNNLKNVGLGYRIFSTDNEGQFPWAVSTNKGGSSEFSQDADNAWRQFVVISNELSSPKILACPQDPERKQAPNFTGFGTNNLSYFVGLLADETQPRSILGGDRNLTTNGVDVKTGLLLLGTNQKAGFSGKIHKDLGNILLGDGSVQQLTSARFQEAVVEAATDSTNAINRLLIP